MIEADKHLKLEKEKAMKMQSSPETMMARVPTPDPHSTSVQEDAMDCKTSWKRYDNPYYCSSQSQQNQHQRKAFIWDLNFIKVFMESELGKARAEIKELKAELDYERKARRRAELVNKRLAKDVEEERMGREAEEMQNKQLLKEISFDKSEMVRMKRDLEEERQMHRLAEVLREERVQMKLMDARLFLEEKLSELEEANRQGETERHRMMKPKILERACSSPARRRWENPHIMRGINPFPRVMRAIRSKSEKWGSKLECQKVQLKILLRQKTTPRCTPLLSSP
ncbi:PREDICTED: protein BRANCHLESS TRICHOME-like [Camelina sativa]|uniref:Protein BRANCHLESS TRICHOME-like n=1 Tax=Camelina sativa TaxID=90675 RepID=A0ABM1RGX9_CAMSA|nr:PREDICTED: protein BRANCHLESS TRICHOME-like [Camelina sativa]